MILLKFKQKKLLREFGNILQIGIDCCIIKLWKMLIKLKMSRKRLAC